MEPVKTSDDVWRGIAWCLTVAFIVSLILAVVGWVLLAWIEFVVYGQMNDFLKVVILFFPLISIGLVITYLLDRNGWI